jgi:hypothetical protein
MANDLVAVKALKDVFGNVDCPSAKNHIRLAARSILLKDFNYDFPNPNPPRNNSLPLKTKEAYVEVDEFNPVPGSIGSRKY